MQKLHWRQFLYIFIQESQNSRSELSYIAGQQQGLLSEGLDIRFDGFYDRLLYFLHIDCGKEKFQYLIRCLVQFYFQGLFLCFVVSLCLLRSRLLLGLFLLQIGVRIEQHFSCVTTNQLVLCISFQTFGKDASDMIQRSQGIQATSIFFHQSLNKSFDQIQRDKRLFQGKDRQSHELTHTHPQGFFILHPSAVDLEEETQHLHPGLLGEAQFTIELEGLREFDCAVLSAKEELGLFVQGFEDRDGSIVSIASFFEHLQQHVDFPLRKEMQLSAETTHDNLQFSLLLLASKGQISHSGIVSCHGEGVQHADGLPSLECLILREELMGKSQQLLLLVGTPREGTKEERSERFGEDFKHGYQLHTPHTHSSQQGKSIYIYPKPIHFPILPLDDKDYPFIIGLQEMKITAELIQHSPQFTNPLNQRQLDLRGYKITAIQNMGATLNFFECIDLSDNELRRLGNFTNLDRLTSIVATNNRIKAISTDLAQSLPNLENIFLMNNKIGELEEIAKLGSCKKLQRLVLANNLVAQLPNYRLFAIAKIPSLRILDFAKISAKQRREAQAMFGTEQSSKK